MSVSQLIEWHAEQLKVFRREVLRENSQHWARHWIQESGRPIQPRTTEGWESMTPKRVQPSYFIRCQISIQFRQLASRYPELWEILPPNLIPRPK